MKLFAIFAKPESQRFDDEALPIRAVAQKFSWYAFLLTPFWAIHRRLLKAFMIWLGVTLAILVLASLVQFEAFWPLLLLGLWFGFEAAQFQSEAALGNEEVATTYLLATNQLEAEILAISANEEAST